LKIMSISGMGFFTDAYDLFIIGVVMVQLKPREISGKIEEAVVQSTALIAAVLGAPLFGRVAEMLGRNAELLRRLANENAPFAMAATASEVTPGRRSAANRCSGRESVLS
jgi:MFS family permease